MARCSRGKSCGATCINSSRKCVIDLGPKASADVKKVVENLGVVQMYHAVVAKGDRGAAARFHSIQQQLKEEVGGRINKEHRPELQRRLQEAGLLSGLKKQTEAEPSFIRKAREKADAFQKAEEERQKARQAKEEIKPDSKWGKWKTEDLQKMKKFFENREEGPKRNMQLERINKELARREGAQGVQETIKKTQKDLTNATGNTRYARESAKDFDKDLANKPLRREGDKSFDGWEGSYDKGSSKIGEGAFGAVMRSPDGTFIKRGEVSDTEAALIKRVGELGIGPKLIAADINGKSDWSDQVTHVEMKNGRIAMSQVPGKEIGNVPGTAKLGGGVTASDAYWKTMAKLHREGIAHNDAHVGNVFIDNKGEGRWVDMGMAQASPKAALAEALGTFGNTLQGANPFKHMPDDAMGHVHEFEGNRANWQAHEFEATGVKGFEGLRQRGMLKQAQERYPVLNKFHENRAEVQRRLLKKYDRDEVAAIMEHGIRSPLHTFEQGPWAKMTNEEAQNHLNELYDGI